MKRSRVLAIVAAAAIPLVASGFLLQSRSAAEGPVLLEQVLSIVSSRFVDTVPDASLYEKAARGLVRELNDPYSELLSPKDRQQFNTRTGGRYGGLGMLIEDQQGQITIAKVYPNTPAERGGVREGDRIVRVDTLPTTGWSTTQVSDYLLGTPGTKVNVRFARPGISTPIDLQLTRAVIHIPAVPYTLMLDGNVGYVPLQTFNENATEETANSIRTLLGQGAKGIVLDLRGNPGGILEQSLSISNLFLRAGQQIAEVRARSGESQKYPARGQTAVPTAPLIVLTDQGSASASEIVAGALQDHDRALVLGQTSFGKGLVQSVYDLDGGYALKLTTAKWFTPSGRSIQRERKIVDGRFVEDAPDTNETEASKRDRPVFKSDAGRTVYGGGGITPDLIVTEDTLSTAEQQFIKAIAPKSQDLYLVLHEYSLELSKQVKPDFQVSPAMRDEFYKRLQGRGATVDRPLFDGASMYIDRLLGERVARFAFGDSTAKRREIPNDRVLLRAVELMKRSQSQAELFTAAQAVNAAAGRGRD